MTVTIETLTSCPRRTQRLAYWWHRRTNLSTHPSLTMPGMAGNL